MNGEAPTETLTRMGLVASIVCAVHCMLTPVIVLFAPHLGRIFSSLEWAEGVLIGSAVALSLWLLYRGAWRRRHWTPVALFGGAVVLLGVGAFAGGSVISTAAGSLLLGGAQLTNLRHQQAHANCEH